MSFVVIQQVVEIAQPAPMHASYAFHFTLPGNVCAAFMVVSVAGILVASYLKGKEIQPRSAAPPAYFLGRDPVDPNDRQHPAQGLEEPFREPFRDPGQQASPTTSGGPPARTIASRFQPAKASQQFDRVLRRTRSFSAHILSNSTKPIMRAPTMFMNQTNLLLTKGTRALNPTRTFIGLGIAEDPSPIAEDPLTTAEDPSFSSDNEITSSDSDQSTTEEEQLLPAPAASAPADTLQLAAVVSRAASEPTSSAPSPPQSPPQSPRSSHAPSLAEQSMTNTMPSLAEQSSSKQSSRASRVRNPVLKDPRRGNEHASEPVRYARAACPENSIPTEVFETRFENPLKFIFRGKGKGAAGDAPASHTKKRNSLKKSSAKVRRMLSTVYMPFASEAAAAVQAAEPEEESTSRRSSVASTSTGPSEAASIRSSASKGSGLSRRSIPRSDSRAQTIESGEAAEVETETQAVPPRVGTPAGSTA